MSRHEKASHQSRQLNEDGLPLSHLARFHWALRLKNTITHVIDDGTKRLLCFHLLKTVKVNNALRHRWGNAANPASGHRRC
ncbi:hypothetical protein [Rhizobium sp. R634]|uniref:hypothetical protein n=1 Tax=Rhizobium sp. R634 TaxID=1764274 RepID=UPI00167CECA3|nr:hypothetical protein [Rhizobium sp. R634]